MFSWFGKPKNKLYGFDLNKWNYIGQSTIRYKNGNEIAGEACLFFFIHKETKKRKYVLKVIFNNMYGDKFSNHPWVIKFANLWASGEMKDYEIIITEPSDYMKKYMYENYQSVFTKNGWQPVNHRVKYEKALLKQKEKKEKDNVIKVDFNNKD